MKTTTEDLCIYFLCFMLGYVFCQNMRGTEGYCRQKDRGPFFGWPCFYRPKPSPN